MFTASELGTFAYMNGTQPVQYCINTLFFQHQTSQILSHRVSVMCRVSLLLFDMLVEYVPVLHGCLFRSIAVPVATLVSASLDVLRFPSIV